MKALQTTAVLAAFLLIGACASSPDIPEESSGEKPSYQSTKEGDDAPQKSEEKESAESGEKTAESAAKSKSTPPEATGPVAHVDGDPIPAEKFNDEMKKVAKTGKFPVALLHQFKNRLIDRLVDQKLIDNAIDEASVEVSDKEVDQKLDDVRSEFDEANKKSGGKVRSLDQVARKYGISDDELRESVKRSIAIEKLLVDKGMKLPTDEEVKKFYEDNKGKFTRPEQVHARHILKKVKPDADKATWKEAKEKIEEIRNEAVKKETDFKKLAEKKSDGPSAKNGGDIGFISKKQFDQNFTKAAFKLEKDEISEPVRTKYGWHIIQLVERRESKVVPYEKVKDRLAKQLKNRKVQKQLQSFLAELRKGAEVEKHPENIE